MLKLGVELYETDTSQLKNDSFIGGALRGTIGRSHSKLIIIDRETTFVGSMNLDFRSSRVNTELGMLVDSPELAEKVLSLAERVKKIAAGAKATVIIQHDPRDLDKLPVFPASAK